MNLILKLIEPQRTIFKEAKLDYAMVAKNLSFVLTISEESLSDHQPILLKISLPVTRRDDKILLPNRRLAERFLSPLSVMPKIQNHGLSP